MQDNNSDISENHGEHEEDREQAEAETEIFRQYLEEHGIIEMWTRVLSDLWLMPPSERPENPAVYIAQEIGNAFVGPIQARNKVVDELRLKLITSESEKKIYVSRNSELLQQIEELEKLLPDQEKAGKRRVEDDPDEQEASTKGASL